MPADHGAIGVVLDVWPHPVTSEGRVRLDLRLPAGTTLEELLEAQNLIRADLTPPEVMLNGTTAPTASWPLTALSDGAVVTVRAAAGLPLAIAAAATVLPSVLGLTGVSAALVSLAVYAAGGLIANSLAPTRPADIAGPDNPRPDPVYSLTGGANRARPYEPLPLVLGRHRLYPDLAAKEYTEYEGGEQYLNQIFHFGLGDLEVTDLMIGATPITSFEEVTTQWSDAQGRITLVAGNVDTTAGAELGDTAWVSRDTPDGTGRIGIDLTGRIFEVSDDGTHTAHSVTVEVRRRRGTGAWSTHRVTLTHASADPHRRTVTYDLPARGVWTVEVRRTAARSESERVYDEVHWAALRSYQPDTADYSGQTRLAVRIRATGQLNGRLDRLSGLVGQKIPRWNAAAGSWGAEGSVSSNPAEILRWYARGVRIGGQVRAGAGLDDRRIDHAGLGAFAEWCAARGLRCDIPLTGSTHDEAVHLIAQCGRGSVTWQPGRLSAVWEDPDRRPSGMVSPGNIIEGTFRAEYASGPVADEVVLQFIDPRMDWQRNSVRRTRPGLTGPVQRSSTVFARGVIDPDQAAEECNLQTARQLYHKRRLSWDMAAEGRVFAKGDVVWITHSLIDGGETGRIAGGTRSRIDLGRSVDVGAGDWILIRSTDGGLHQSAVSRAGGGSGATREVNLTTPLASAPGAPGTEPHDAIWRIYDNARPPLRARIIGVRPVSDRRFRFTAIDETAAYHRAATSDLSVPFAPVRPRLPHVYDVQFSARRIRTAGAEVVELRAALTVGGDWQGGVVRAGVTAADYAVVERLSGPADLDARWIVPVDTGQVVQIVPGTLDSPTGPVWTGSWAWDGGFRPSPPTGFAVAVADNRSRRFSFQIPAGAVGVRIRYSDTDGTAWDDATRLGTGLIVSSPYETTDPAAGTWYFQIRAYSAEGLASEPALLTAELGGQAVPVPPRARGWFELAVSESQQTAIEAVAEGADLPAALTGLADGAVPGSPADGDKVTFRRAYTVTQGGSAVSRSFTSTWEWSGTAWRRAFPWIGSEVIGDKAITARNAFFENLAALDLQVRNADIGEAIRARNLNVDGRLILNSETASFLHGKVESDDLGDGIYFGRSATGFALATSVQVAGVREEIVLSERGLVIQNPELKIATGIYGAETKHTSAGTVALAANADRVAIAAIGGGSGGGGTNAGDRRGITNGEDGGATVVEVLDGSTVEYTLRAVGGVFRDQQHGPEARAIRIGEGSVRNPDGKGGNSGYSWWSDGNAFEDEKASNIPAYPAEAGEYATTVIDLDDFESPSIRIVSVGEGGEGGNGNFDEGEDGGDGAVWISQATGFRVQEATVFSKSITDSGTVAVRSNFNRDDVLGAGAGLWILRWRSGGGDVVVTIDEDTTLTFAAALQTAVFVSRRLPSIAQRENVTEWMYYEGQE
ncbi:MAG: host specificity factor TipJ family phage tail protein [Rhodobacteraceae bacterium]|nr:host specificity factor TipJ family phage tail protein [Paracoccaceae bacterium]